MYGRNGYGSFSYAQSPGWLYLGQLVKDIPFTFIQLQSNEITVKFKDSNGFLKYAWNSRNDDFNFILGLKFSFINGESCDSLSLTLSELPEDLSDNPFRLEWMNIIEVYLYDMGKPVWSGYVIKMPDELKEDKQYEYQCLGFIHRLKSIPIDNTYENISVDDILEDITIQISKYDERIFFNPDGFLKIGTIIEEKDFDNATTHEAIDELAKIAGNAAFGIDGNRHFFFKEKDLEVDTENTVFHVDMPELNIKISRTNLDKIENWYVVERKADSDSGTTDVTGSIVTGDSQIYSLDGQVKQLTSIEQYGVFFKKLQIPSAAADEDALLYAVELVLKNAFPKYKGSISNIPISNYTSPLYAEGLAKIFGKEKKNLIEIEKCEDESRWTDGSNMTIDQELYVIHSGNRSIKVNATGASIGDYVYVNLLKEYDLSQATYISFWCRTNTTKAMMKFSFGNSDATTFQYDFMVSKPNFWEQKKFIINLPNININRIGIITNNTEDYDLYIDEIELYTKERKEFEIEIKKAEYVFSENMQVINLTIGEIEVPLVDEVTKAIRNIRTLEQTTKNNS